MWGRMGLQRVAKGRKKPQRVANGHTGSHSQRVSKGRKGSHRVASGRKESQMVAKDHTKL